MTNREAREAINHARDGLDRTKRLLAKFGYDCDGTAIQERVIELAEAEVRHRERLERVLSCRNVMLQ